MSELSADPISETSYDSVVPLTGDTSNGETFGTVSQLTLLDLSHFLGGVELSLSLAPGALDAEASHDYLDYGHRFYGMDDVLLGEGLDQVTIAGALAYGYGENDRLPVVDASASSGGDLLTVSQDGLSEFYERYEFNMETGLLTGWDGFWGATNFGRYVNFNHFTFLPDHAITIQGSVGADTIFIASDVAATVNAGEGWDLIISGAGGEIINGGEGVDHVSYAEATSGVTVYVEFSGRDVGGGCGADHFISVEDLTGSDFDDRLIGDDIGNFIYGETGDDVIKGKDGNDFLSGQDGADRLFAGEGNDTLDGGAGADTLFGDAGTDAIAGGADNDFLYGGRDNDTLYGEAGDDRLKGNLNDDLLDGGTGKDTLFGGGGQDTLLGDEGDDHLLGENGNDRLDGGAGDDVLYGGGGQDVFVYNLTGLDKIRDFEDGVDQIDLSEIAALSTFADVSAIAGERWDGVVLEFGDENILYIGDITLGDLDASDVIL
jgi:Ca2+-binding RTX toxin-like protein